MPGFKLITLKSHDGRPVVINPVFFAGATPLNKISTNSGTVVTMAGGSSYQVMETVEQVTTAVETAINEN